MTSPRTPGSASLSEVPAVRHNAPSSLVYVGLGSVEAAGREVARAGTSRVVLVTSPSLAGSTHAARVKAALGDALVATFGDVQKYSPIPVVLELSALLTRVAADGVVVLGGGSSIVTARAASVLSAEDRPFEELRTRRDETGKVVNPAMPARKVPQWIVPSTPTTAYGKAGVAMRDPGTGTRVALFDPKVRARGVFLDPDVASSAPAALVRSAALNALSMALEGLLATRHDPFAEALLNQAVREISGNLAVVEDLGGDRDARLRLMSGALLAGQGSDFSGGGLALALAHALAPHASYASGVLESRMVTRTLPFSLETVPDRSAVVAEALGLDPRSSVANIVGTLERIVGDAGVPQRLRDMGVSYNTLDTIVEAASTDWAIGARLPRTATRDELRSLIVEAW